MFYRSVGDVPRKRHLRTRDAHGNLLAEELMAVHGFSGEGALLYHRHSPSAIVAAEAVTDERAVGRAHTPVLPQHYVTGKLPAGGDLVTRRHPLLCNEDVVVAYTHATETSPLARNAVGDELVYLQRGDAVLETVFGALHVREGDYVVLPSTTTHRWVVDGPVEALILEATGHVTVPAKYLSAEGQFLEHAPYCERDIRTPSEPLVADGERVEVLVRHRQGCTRYVYAHHPFDVVGWDGCMYPYTFNVSDYEPITGRIHQPPPVHQVFEAWNFVICNFVPRKVDYHPLAVPVPYYHSNVDSDEVMFYCGGDYEARKGSGIGQGSISLHPGGHSHGPQPGAVERSLGAQYFDELAVMVDTFRPLELGEGGRACEDPAYAWSWAGRGPQR
jgi:homogentisate 1,2-dioxygenase